jgi:hypothetical protein
VRTLAAQLVEARQRVSGDVVHGRRLGSGLADAIGDEVPVVLEGTGEGVDGVGAHATSEQQQDGPLEVAVGQQLLAKGAPPPLVLDAGADLVEHLDPRREAGLDRVLAEDPLGERVQRSDRRRVELVERRPAAPSDVGVAGAGLLL